VTRLRRRLDKLEEGMRASPWVDPWRAPHPYFQDFFSRADGVLLQEAIELRNEGREQELSEQHRALLGKWKVFNEELDKSEFPLRMDPLYWMSS
jgi:hypothetical protein